MYTFVPKPIFVIFLISGFGNFVYFFRYKLEFYCSKKLYLLRQIHCPRKKSTWHPKTKYASDNLEEITRFGQLKASDLNNKTTKSVKPAILLTSTNPVPHKKELISTQHLKLFRSFLILKLNDKNRSRNWRSNKNRYLVFWIISCYMLHKSRQ